VNVKGPGGARGDGLADDTAAIQRAVNAVGGTGGTVWIPPGIYRVDTLAASGGAGIVLRDDMTLRMDPGTVLQAIPNAAANYTILTATRVSRVNILGGTLQGDRDAHRGSQGEWGMGLEIHNASQIVVQEVQARDCWGDGFYVSGTSRGITFCRVVADRNRRQGMSIVGGRDLLVRDSTFSNTGGTLPEYGIDVEPEAGEAVSDLVISGCRFTGNAGGGVALGPATRNRTLASVTRSTLAGNLFTGNGAGGLNSPDTSTVDISACDGNTVSGNLFRDNLGHGLLLRSQATGMLVTGNTIIRSSLDGIHLSECAGSVISRNQVTASGGWGIHDRSGSGAILRGNTLTGNGVGP
jgi:parallel beta-helix repeat protein